MGSTPNYESYYKQICMIFQKLVSHPMISYQLKSRNFKLSLVEQLFEKSEDAMDDLESNLVTKKLKSGKKDFAYNQNSQTKENYDYCLASPAIPKKKNYNSYPNDGCSGMSCELSPNQDPKNNSNTKSTKINFYRVYKGNFFSANQNRLSLLQIEKYEQQ
jgi:hypothetical protein